MSPEYWFIQDVVRSGVLGRIFSIKHGSYGFGRRNDWQTLRKYGGGQLNNNGVHIIDQVVQLIDSPITQVFGDLQQVLNPGDCEDHVKVVFRGGERRGRRHRDHHGLRLPLPSWVLMGTRGTLISDGTRRARLRYTEAKKLPALKPIDSIAAVGRKYGTGETLTFTEETRPASLTPPKNFYDYLYDSLRKGKPLLVTPESSQRTMQVMQLARKGTPFA